MIEKFLWFITGATVLIFSNMLFDGGAWSAIATPLVGAIFIGAQRLIEEF